MLTVVGSTTGAATTGAATGGPDGADRDIEGLDPAGVTIPTRVLAMGMVSDDGRLAAGDLYGVAEACGQSPEQVRSCLRRLVAEGLFVRAGEGRDATFDATEAGMATLGVRNERTRLAYVQDAAGRGWDGVWHLVAFAIPESRRGARDALRDRLLGSGGAAVQGGLYVSPHPWEKDVRGEAERLDVADHVTFVTTRDLDVGGVTDPRRLAARLWPVDDLAARYTAFLERYQRMPEALEELRHRKRRLADSAFLPMALEMAVSIEEASRADPLLPPELLPRPWPGRAARDLVARSRRLALLARADHDRPVLFRFFDDIVESLPTH